MSRRLSIDRRGRLGHWEVSVKRRGFQTKKKACLVDQGRVGDYVVMGDEARKHWQPVSALVGAQDCTPDPQTPVMSVLTYVHI